MPDEPVPQLGEKEYEVVGRNSVLGHATGEKFKANFTAEQEAFYVGGGHLAASTGDTIEEIIAAVGTDKAKAQAALEAEQARTNPRTSLVSALEKLAREE